MKKILRSLALVVGLLPALADAQVAIQTFPANTVYGRIGGGQFGPGGTIPLSTLAANLGLGVPAHSVVIGKGTTFPGFNGLAPSTPGQLLIDQGSGADPAFKAASGSCTVDVNGVFACSIVGGGVNTVTANYSIQPSDCFKTVQGGTGATGSFTFTLPSPSGFPAGCPITVYNGDDYAAGNSTGKVLSGFPATAFYILFPRQTVSIAISNGAWAVTKKAGRWQQPGVDLYVANSNHGGSDTANDCMSLVTPCQTINHTIGITYNNVDHQGGEPNIILNAGDTFAECVDVQGQLTGVNVGQIISSSGSGTSGGATWGPVAGSCPNNALFTIADNAEWQVGNIFMTNAGGTSGIDGIHMHQTGVVDVLAGMNFGMFPGATAIGSDNNSMINIDASYTITAGGGTTPTFFGIGPATTLNECGACTTTFISSPAITTMYSVSGAGATVNFGPSHAFSGAATISQACSVTGPSAISMSSNTLPGTTACSSATAAHNGVVF
jgi:hypothetical protein